MQNKLHITKYYFECHITIDPVLIEENGELLRNLCAIVHFKVANLFMLKTGDRSEKDTFMTGHSKDLEALIERMIQLLDLLKLHNFPIRRYKIEEIIIDSRNEDVFPGYLPQTT